MKRFVIPAVVIAAAFLAARVALADNMSPPGIDHSTFPDEVVIQIENAAEFRDYVFLAGPVDSEVLHHGRFGFPPYLLFDEAGKVSMGAGDLIQLNNWMVVAIPRHRFNPKSFQQSPILYIAEHPALVRSDFTIGKRRQVREASGIRIVESVVRCERTADGLTFRIVSRGKDGFEKDSTGRYLTDTRSNWLPIAIAVTAVSCVIIAIVGFRRRRRAGTFPE